jgi:hypothetical protein
MAKTLDPKIAKAEKKVIDAGDQQATARKAANPGGFLLSIFKASILPALPAIIAEILKKASKSQKKYLIAARDALNAAELD